MARYSPTRSLCYGRPSRGSSQSVGSRNSEPTTSSSFDTTLSAVSASRDRNSTLARSVNLCPAVGHQSRNSSLISSRSTYSPRRVCSALTTRVSSAERERGESCTASRHAWRMNQSVKYPIRPPYPPQTADMSTPVSCSTYG